ncbi:Zinc finger and BTB domain-containing protein 17 [Lasiodiplodia theobromae]|uniref:Zinc finger and BTB domain-containing protein 17 n=1 Tax=Lasiodiplodia theobromae TaxID=45133 RepID=A0A5N5D128_9PEZI|nr:Zinc finger and BTB domain-containing protein 17 [Lasiodiplodia theobromae]
MSQNRYPPYTTYDAYFNAPPRAFEKQMEPGMQAILDSRHPMPRPFDTFTYPGYEGSFQTTSPAIDQGLQALLSANKPHASARDTYSNPIASFYHDADGPWNSVRATSQARGSTANPTLTVPNLDYNSYRDAPASEISDSGYASQAAASQSIVNTNTEPTDYNRECGDLPVQVNSFSFTPTTHSSPAYGSPSFQTRNPDRTGIRSQSQNTLTCTRCGEVAKCRSDFKKHQLKHTKPWVCDVPDCTRKEGFTTVNDLQRHQKSVHRMGGMTKSFRCVADRCKNKDKLWPRLDNFKQHVQRMHKTDNMDDLIQRSQCSDPNPPRTRSVSPIDNALTEIDSRSSSPDLTHHKDSPYLAISPDRDEAESSRLAPDVKSYPRPHQGKLQQYQGNHEQPLHMPDDQKPALSPRPDAPRLKQSAAAATTRQTDAKNNPKSGRSKNQSLKRTSATEAEQPRLYGQLANVIASKIANGASDESLKKRVLKALLEVDPNEHIIAATSHRKSSAGKETRNSRHANRSPPGFRGPDGTETTISTAEVKTALATLSKKMSQKPNAVGKRIKCRMCPKLFRIPSELNKHQKRHTKPYGCTFSKCFKELGSKHDWKRHENSHGAESERWRCEQPFCDRASLRPSAPPLTNDDDSTTSSDATPKVCGVIFYDTTAFSAHLRSQHSLPEPQITTELCVRRIGRNRQSRFWCGFCESIIVLKTRGDNAWDDRCDHINFHFSQGEHIRDWLDVETNKRR